MSIAAVGLLSPGDMGHAVGRALREHGLDVLTCLDGRSDRTRALAAAADLRDVPTLDDLVASTATWCCRSWCRPRRWAFAGTLPEQ